MPYLRNRQQIASMKAAQRLSWHEIARGNIERNLANCTEEDGEDAVHDSAYTLALDALLDAGCEPILAREIATEEAAAFAQP